MMGEEIGSYSAFRLQYYKRESTGERLVRCPVCTKLYHWKHGQPAMDNGYVPVGTDPHIMGQPCPVIK